MTLDEQMNIACERGMRSLNRLTPLMQTFARYCLEENWNGASEAHLEAVAALDAYFDHLGAAFKLRAMRDA